MVQRRLADGDDVHFMRAKVGVAWFYAEHLLCGAGCATATSTAGRRCGWRRSKYQHRAVIAFEVDDAAGRVAVLGVFYGGRDYERAFSGDDPDVGGAD